MKPNKRVMHVLMIVFTTVFGLLMGEGLPIIQYTLIGWILGYATGVICEHESILNEEGEDQ